MSFLMQVEDVFSVPGRGTVVTGTIQRGAIGAGEKVEIVGLRETARATCIGVESFRERLDEGRAGQHVGIRLGGIGRDDIERGQVLVKPGSIRPWYRFEALTHFLYEEAGGRKLPYFAGDRLQFGFGTVTVAGHLVFPGEMEMVLPGDRVKLEVELELPVALEMRSRVWIGDGKSLGSGEVTNLIV